MSLNRNENKLLRNEWEILEDKNVGKNFMYASIKSMRLEKFFFAFYGFLK